MRVSLVRYCRLIWHRAWCWPRLFKAIYKYYKECIRLALGGDKRLTSYYIDENGMKNPPRRPLYLGYKEDIEDMLSHVRFLWTLKD